MANPDNPHGLRCIGHMFGVQPEIEQMDKDASGGVLYQNDTIVQETDGNITIGAAGAAISGVNTNYGATGVASTHLVIVDPFAIFEAQDNNDTNGFDSADRGGNVDIEFTTAAVASNPLKISLNELDESTFQTTNTLQCHLRKLYSYQDASGANAYGANGRWEVSFNNHRRMTGQVGLA